MLQFLGQSFSIVIPIFVAGIVFITVLKTNALSSLDVPIDFGKSIRKRRIFGDNKTWRGVFVYVPLTIFVCYILSFTAYLYPGTIHSIFLQNPLIVGLLFSICYIVGELINSSVKRQLGIAPGSSTHSRIQTIIDNVDGMIVVAAMLLLVFNVSIWSILTALMAGYSLHKLTDIMMKRRLGLK